MSTRGYPWYRESHRCWYVWHEGRQVRLHRDEREALALWHRLEAGVWEPDGAGQGPTLAEVVGQYLKHYSARSRAGSVYIASKTLGRLAGTPYADQPACSFDAEKAGAFLESAPSWGPSMRRMFCCQVKACLRWALATRRIVRFPLEGWAVRGVRSKRPGCVVSRETHEALVRAALPWLADVLTALRNTGCRPSEVYSVTADDYRGGCWVLREHKTSGATNRPRIVHLSVTMDILTRRLAARRHEGPLFRNGKGMPVNAKCVASAVEDLCRRLGLPHVYPYAYRHTYATDLLEAGVPDSTVAELMGHTGTKILHQHYSHLTQRQRHLRDSLGKARE